VDEMALHVLDIGMNAVAAGARRVEITVVEDVEKDRLEITVADDGRGMDPEEVRAVLERFSSGKAERKRSVALGLALLRQTAETCDGEMSITSAPGAGTRIDAWMRYSDYDRPPLGSLADTVFALCVGAPEVDVECTHRRSGTVTCFDSAQVRRALGPGVSLQSPEGVRAVRRALGSKG
jgi:hypothetical protein